MYNRNTHVMQNKPYKHVLSNRTRFSRQDVGVVQYATLDVAVPVKRHVELVRTEKITVRTEKITINVINWSLRSRC